jgi:Na+-transporting NADH:ubiquinone oxidoreductase subunit NqrB
VQSSGIGRISNDLLFFALLENVMKPIDPRNYQIAFLGLFLLLGVSTRDWSLQLPVVTTAIIGCCLQQLIAKAIFQPQENPFPSLCSALITSLGLSLLLRTGHPATMLLASSLAIWSKFIFRWEDKHFFNPANFGIVAAIALTGDAWVSPGQWGEDWWYLLLFLGAGAIVLKKVGRWDTSMTFLLAYASLEAIRNLWLGWTWDVLAHKLMSGSLIMFALFMVTDPRSIPNAKNARIVWAIAIALLTFMLRNFFYLPNAVFYALFIMSPITILLDYLWTAPAFSWYRSRFTHTFALKMEV